MDKSATPSVLRAYRLLADGTTPFYAQYQFGSTGTDIFTEQVGTAVTWVPGDPDHVYVAMGIDWLWSISVGSSTFAGARIATGSLSTCSLVPCPYGEMMRDAVGVRNASGDGFVYAALEYGRVLEYALDAQPAPAVSAFSVPCVIDGMGTLGRTRLECISAAMQGDFAVVAVGLIAQHGRYEETRAPYHPTGFWNDQCYGVGVIDPNGAISGECDDVLILGRCTLTSDPLMQLSHDPIDAPSYWNTLILQGNDWVLRCYQSTMQRAALHELTPSMGPMGPMGPGSFPPAPCGEQPVHLDVQQVATYVGRTFSAADGIFSLRDPDLTYVGHDGGPDYLLEGRQAYLQASPRDIVPVPHTVSVCATRTEPIPKLLEHPNGPCPAPPATTVSTGDPNPFIGSILGSASWVDPNDAEVEWFLPGGDLWRRADPATCAIYVPSGGGPGECAASPCVFPLAWLKDGFATDRPDVGWKLVRLETANPAHVVPDGVNLGMKWWQFEAPSMSPGEGSRSIDVPYLFATVDPRFALADPGDAEEIPVLIHGVRGGSKLGYKVFRPQDLMARAAQDEACAGAGLGYGENLALTAETTVPFLESLTHVEFEEPGNDEPCLVLSCGGTIARHIFNGKLDLFTVTSEESETRVIAVMATGFIATEENSQQPTDCSWADPMYSMYSSNHPLLLTLYDVTDTHPGFTRPPLLIRVGIGPANGNAFAVRTKTYPELEGSPTCAFVANFMGTLEVFDVSYSVLFNPTPPGAGERYWPGNPLLIPVPGASIAFDTDPYDGKVPNVVDVEIDGDFAYCALSRAGVAVVDIQDPLQPVLVAVLDTPGLAQGLMLRTDAQGHHQLLVGDSRAGPRLYGVPGE